MAAAGPGTIYELLASVTKSRDDFDPLGAMVLAKSANEDKSDDEKIIGGRWEWSPQVRDFLASLGTRCSLLRDLLRQGAPCSETYFGDVTLQSIKAYERLQTAYVHGIGDGVGVGLTGE